MNDIKDLVSLPNPSTPDVAVKNIDNANLFDTDPTVYKDLAPDLDPKAKALNSPQMASPAVDSYMRQSTEHAAAATPDVPHLSAMDEIVKYTGDIIFNRPTVEQQINNLARKKLDHPDQFTDDDELQLLTLNGDEARRQQALYGTDGPSFMQQVGHGVAEMGRGLRRNADLIATFTGLGAAAGLATSGPSGAVKMGATGFGLGVTSAFAIDSYDSTRASVYNELSNISKPDGSPMDVDENTKRFVANGTGLISAAITGGMSKFAMKADPVVSKFIGPKMAQNLITNPLNAAILKSVVNIGEAISIGSGAGTLMETTRLVAEEMGKTYDGSEASLISALNAVGSKLYENKENYRKRLGGAAVVGGGVAGVLAIGTNVLNAKSSYADFQQRSEWAFNEMSRRARTSRDVTPETQTQLPGGKVPNPDAPIDVTPEAPGGGGLRLLKAPKDPVTQSVEALHFQDALEGMNKIGGQTKLNELSPNQMAEFKAGVFARAGITKIFLLPEDLRKWANNPEKADEVRALLNPGRELKVSINAPVEVDPTKFAGFIEKNPDASDLARVQADGPSAGQAREFLNKIQDTDARRIQLLSKLGLNAEELVPKPEEKSNVTEMPERPPTEKVDLEAVVKRTDEILTELQNPEITEPLQKKLNSELETLKTQVQDHYLKGPGDLIVADWGLSEHQVADQKEASYMSEPVYTEAIKTVVPEAEMERFTAAVNAGKKSIQEDIQFALDHELRKVQDVVKVIADETALEEAKAIIANDPRYALVDRFRAQKTPNSKGKKFSVYAIDPKTLTKDQLHWLDNPRLKEHKVFNKPGEGLTPDFAASLIGGVKDGNDLLTTLATTPTREQINKARADFMKVQNHKEAMESVDYNWTNKLKSYDNQTKLAADLSKYLREKEWPAYKQAIKRVAFPPIIPKEIAQKAREFTLKTKIGELNVEQYEVGERQSRKAAVKAILEARPEKAHVALESQALNIQLQKHQMLAIGQANKDINFAARFRDKGTWNTLAAAGKLYVNAAKELLDVFNLDPAHKGTSERDSYVKFVQAKLRRGEGDFSIPERLSDVRTSVNDMTVEQLNVVANRLRAILQTAKLKNRLVQKQKDAEEFATMEEIRNEFKTRLPKSPFYSEKKTPPVQKNNSKLKELAGKVRSHEALFTNMEHILRELDDGVVGGYFQQLLYHGLKGDGEFYKKSGYTRELEMSEHFLQHHNKLVEKYGKGFHDIERVKFNVPEFSGIPQLNNGENVTKGDLIVLWLMGGDPYLKEKRLTNNGGVSHEIMQKVFDRLLEARDVEYGQAIVDMFKDYREETVALQKRTTGQEVQFVEGTPNRWRDRVFTGGYMPAKYRIDYTEEGIKDALKALSEKKATWFDKDPMRYFAAETTEQGRLISRTDSDKPLDWSLMRLIRGHEEVIHDFAYREPVMDALKILKDKEIRAEIIKRVGLEKYNVLTNTVIEIATRAEADNINYFHDQSKTWKNLQTSMKKHFDIMVLGINPNSALVQLASAAETLQILGPKAVDHWATMTHRFLADPTNINGYYALAAQLDPTIGHYLEGLHNTLVSNVMKVVPQKGNKITQSMGYGYNKLVDAMMSPMQIMDIVIKVNSALTVYSQFMSGDVEGYPIEKVLAMTPEEQEAKAQALVSQVSRLALTHGRPEDRAPFQKLPGADFLSYYWNDGRNALNNIISLTKRATGVVKQASDLLGEDGSGFGGGGKKGPPDATPSDGPGGGGRRGGSGPNLEELGGAGKYIATAAGMVMVLVVSQMLRRLWEDTIRENQVTPFNYDLNYKSAQGLQEAGKIWSDYMISSPTDQLFANHPMSRSVMWAAGNIWEKSKKKRVDIPITKMQSDYATSIAYLQDYMKLGVSPTESQVEAMLRAQGYLPFGIPLPINGLNHVGRWFGERNLTYLLYQETRDVLRQSTPTSKADELKAQIEQYKKLHEGDDSKKELVAHLDTIDSQLGPKSDAVPKDLQDSIKMVESPNSKSVYGFTKEQWSYVSKSAPELGLTEAGRTSSDTLQQDLAMDWTLRDNARQLSDKNMTVDGSSLYGVYKFGFENYEKLVAAPADSKLKNVWGAETIAKHPEISNYKTVGQVKTYLKSKLNEGQNKLTSPTANNED